MKYLKFTVIIPVYNEMAGIKEFFDSLYAQTRKPDEIIVVDGKSNDGTYEFLKHEQKKGRLHVFSYACNIAEARNFAIQKSKHDIILCTDAGCKIDKHRCESLMHVYETTDEKVVGGKSEYLIKSDFQKLVAKRIISPYDLDHFASSRNISFYKSIWKEVGGYPEFLTKWGEDTYFNRKIEKAGYKIHYCPTAIVSWGMGKNYKDFYKMYSNYTQGDAEVRVTEKVVQSDSIKQAIRFSIFFLVLLWCLLVLGGWGIVITILAGLGIGLYKNSGGGFWFDLKFSLTKMAGMSVGLWKGVWHGWKIRNAR